MTLKHLWTWPHSVQGQLLRRSERREVAIFLRDGALWVADFIDGNGQLIDATTWFRFNCGALESPHARHRMLHESATPLSADLVHRIEQLCSASTTPHRGPIARLIDAFVKRRPNGNAASTFRKRHRGEPPSRIDPTA